MDELEAFEHKLIYVGKESFFPKKNTNTHKKFNKKKWFLYETFPYKHSKCAHIQFVIFEATTGFVFVLI